MYEVIEMRLPKRARLCVGSAKGEAGRANIMDAPKMAIVRAVRGKGVVDPVRGRCWF